MKRKIFQLILVSIFFLIICQPSSIGQVIGKKFNDQKEVWTTPNVSQGETGLCALFSDISFLESELHRLGGGDFELSTMFVAYYFYVEKALRRIRLRGKVDFGFHGGFNYDAFEMIRKYGIVPRSEYTGLQKGQTEHQHNGFIKEMNSYMDYVGYNGKNGNLRSFWKEGTFHSNWLDSLKFILNENLGTPPLKIKAGGDRLTPIQFSEKKLSIPFNDYYKFTSYSYIGFEKKGELLASGNWLHKQDFYNIRLDEYMNLIDYALENGFSLTGDFHITVEMYNGKGYIDFQIDSLNSEISQNIRDNLYENWKTNDVHNVQIIGIAYDADGNKYYKIKDSAATNEMFTNPPKYFSENFFRAKVLAVMLHKDGIPLEVRRRFKID